MGPGSACLLPGCSGRQAGRHLLEARPHLGDLLRNQLETWAGTKKGAWEGTQAHSDSGPLRPSSVLQTSP